MKKLILIFFSMAIVSCSKSSGEEQFTSSPVSFAIKFRGEQGGFDYFPNSPDTQTFKITNSTDYNNYVSSLLSHLISPTFNETYSFQPVPDFSIKDILAINYKCIGDLGQRLIVNSVIENVDTIAVNYHWEQTTAVSPASGKPFILIEVPKSNKPVVFIESGN